MSVLVSAATHPHLAGIPERLRALHAPEFGLLACEGLASDLVCPAEAASGQEWRRLVAEEILLAQLLQKSPDLRGREDWRPFGENLPPLGELMARVCWVAVVPVDDPGSGGELRRIWGFDPCVDWVGQSLQGMDELPIGYRILVGGGGVPQGRSWLLGASLAARAAQARHRDMQLALARNWIVTGDVHGHRVNAVRAGRKVEVRSHRRWLVPAAAAAEFRKLDPMHTAERLDDAWTHVSEEGVFADPDAQWDDGFEELHILVGKAVRPLVSSILLARPRRVHLWHTDHPEESVPARDLLWSFLKSDELGTWLGHQPAVIPSLLPANDLGAAEKILRRAGLGSRSEETRLFNITGGNRLMGMAALNVARTNGRLWLVYRELSAKDPTEFVRIRYRDGARSGRLRSQFPRAGVSWDELAARPGQGARDDLASLAGLFSPAPAGQ